MKQALIVLAMLVGAWLFLWAMPAILREIACVIETNVQQEAPRP